MGAVHSRLEGLGPNPQAERAKDAESALKIEHPSRMLCPLSPTALASGCPGRARIPNGETTS